MGKKEKERRRMRGKKDTFSILALMSRKARRRRRATITSALSNTFTVHFN